MHGPTFLHYQQTHRHLSTNPPPPVSQFPLSSLAIAMSLPAGAPANGQAPKQRGKKRRHHPSHRPLLERGFPQEAAGQQQQQQPSEAQQQQQQEQQPQLGNGNTKFARALGSTDYHTREQGLAALSRWLLHRPAVSELDMLKLWRGVFFCFWHSDKERVQEDLAVRLAGLLPQLQPAMARLYWAGMLATLRVEWFAMDRHRVNKFLMLVRKFVAAVLQRMAASNWDVSVIRAFTGADLPMGQALLPLDHTKSLGFSYHLADVWLPELRAAAGEQSLPPGALQALLQPFADVLQLSGEVAQVARVRESVFEVLVQDLAAAAAAAAGAGPSSSSESEDEDDGSAWAYCAQLDTQEYAEHLFSLGAAPDVKSRNREALYGVSKQLERVAAKRRKLAPPASGAAAAAEHGGRVSAGLSNGAADSAAAAAAAAGEGGSASKKQKKASKKRSKAEAAVQQALADAEQQLGAAAAPPRSSSSSSSKKHKQQQQQQEQPSPGNQQQQPQQHTPDAAAAAAAVTPGSGSQQKRKKHKQGGKTPGGTGSKPRGVVINLRDNLYHEHGAPPPAADVRTPPRSKPKGSALKPVSKFELERSGGGSGRGNAARVTPNSVPRVRAAVFF